MNQQPDYNNYTLDELYDAYNHIDKEKYPERTTLIINEIKVKEKESKNPQIKLKEPYNNPNLKIVLGNGSETSNLYFETIESTFKVYWNKSGEVLSLKYDDSNYISVFKTFIPKGYSIVWKADGNETVYQSKTIILSEKYILDVLRKYLENDYSWRDEIAWVKKGEATKRFYFGIIIPIILLFGLFFISGIRYISNTMVEMNISRTKILALFMFIAILFRIEEIKNIGKITKQYRINFILMFLLIIFILLSDI